MHTYIHNRLGCFSSCKHTYINTYIHTYIHACIHTYITGSGVSAVVQKRKLLWGSKPKEDSQTNTATWSTMSSSLGYVCIHVYVCIYMCVYMCVCMCVKTVKQIQRHGLQCLPVSGTCVYMCMYVSICVCIYITPKKTVKQIQQHGQPCLPVSGAYVYVCMHICKYTH
jgi:hypothetical protein